MVPAGREAIVGKREARGVRIDDLDRGKEPLGILMKAKKTLPLLGESSLRLPLCRENRTGLLSRFVDREHNEAPGRLLVKIGSRGRDEEGNRPVHLPTSGVSLAGGGRERQVFRGLKDPQGI